MKSLKSILGSLFFSLLTSYGFAQHTKQADNFAWEHYKYIVVDQGSYLVFAPIGGIAPWPDQAAARPQLVLVNEDIFEDVKYCFKDFDPDLVSSKQGCISVRPDQFDFIGKNEQAVGFAKLFVTGDEMVQIDVYDVTGGWLEPVFSMKWKNDEVSSSAKKGGKIPQLKEHAEGLSDRLRTRYTKFNLSASNLYFSDSELTAKEMLVSDPSKTGKPATVEEEYPDVMLSLSDEMTTLKSVFVIGMASTDCNGRSTNADGLSQLASQKLNGRYTFLERAQLQALIDEQKLGMSGLIEENTIIDLGKVQGADGVLLCQETCVGGSPMQTVKLLNCTTGAQEWIASTFSGNVVNLFEAILLGLE